MSKYTPINIKDIAEEGNSSYDIYLSDDILAKSRHLPFTEDYMNMFIEWGINNINLDKNTIIEKEGMPAYTFESFLAEYKMLSKVYFSCVDRMEILIIKFKKANFIQKIDFNYIIDDLYELSTRDSTSILNILNIQTYSKEKEFYVRLVNVSMISMMIAFSLKLNKDIIRKIGLGGLLYDIGMVQVNDNILNKFGSLNKEEYIDMQKHTVYGYKIIKNILKLDDEIALVALSHHEAYSGSGYPRNLSENKIHIYSRIVAIAQAMEGMLRNFNVHFKRRISLPQSIREIMRESPNKFDPKIVKVFVNVISIYPVGSVVLLNDNRKGLVFALNREYTMRPLIKIVSDINGEFIKDGESINLFNYKDIYIKQIETDLVFLLKVQESFFGINFRMINDL